MAVLVLWDAAYNFCEFGLFFFFATEEKEEKERKMLRFVRLLCFIINH
jgi:hypothetical protein